MKHFCLQVFPTSLVLDSVFTVVFNIYKTISMTSVWFSLSHLCIKGKRYLIILSYFKSTILVSLNDVNSFF